MKPFSLSLFLFLVLGFNFKTAYAKGGGSLIFEVDSKVKKSQSLKKNDNQGIYLLGSFFPNEGSAENSLIVLKFKGIELKTLKIKQSISAKAPYRFKIFISKKKWQEFIALENSEDLIFEIKWKRSGSTEGYTQSLSKNHFK